MAIQCVRDASGRDGTAGIWWQQWLWPKLLRLARANGWRPMGTSQPPERASDFPGGWDPQNYTTNDNQIVSPQDANCLADALVTAVGELSDGDELAPYRLPDGDIEMAPNPPQIPDAAWFSGREMKQRVTDFIAFCRLGGFEIR